MKALVHSSLMPLFPTLQVPIKVTIKAIKGPVLAKADQSAAYEGQVVVRFGSTKITADRLVVYNGDERGVAEGHVTLIDPDGTAQADRLEFSWNQTHPFGAGDNITIRVANATIRARHATFEPGIWTLLDAEGTTCLRPTPAYLVTSRKIVVVPGQNLRISEPRVSLLGHYVGELPSQNISLSRAFVGLGYPTPAYNVARGFGLGWSGGFIAGRDSTFTFNSRFFQHRKPSALAQYTHSFRPLAEATEVVTPRSDFGERFGFGFLDSVKVDTPETESKFLSAPRSSVGLGFQVNGSVTDRERGSRFGKLEAVYEEGGKAGNVGLLGQVRLQGIRPEQDATSTRLNLSGSAGLPSVPLGRGLSTIARLDSQLFLGKTTYSWTRAMAGVTYLPTPWLRLTGGGFISGDTGTPQFDIDPLYSKNGLLMRADVMVGGLRLSYLAKNDGRLGLYDREIAINQVIGCVEAYYVRRQYPSDSRFGIMLRVQPLIDVFRRRGADGIASSRPMKNP